jgi:histidine ammonia-lyase
MNPVTVNGDAITIEEVVAVACRERRAVLGPGVAARMARSRGVVAAAVEQGRIMYGITTGFGALADTHIGRTDIERMQLALIRSHAAGVGEPLDDPTVRALLLLRARTLAAGWSGVRVDVPARLLELLDRDVLPVVPGKGSVGASGDLAQLAHLALPLVGEGRLRRGAGAADAVPGAGGRWGQPAGEVLAEEGLEPLTLAAKEGLSLINGTEPMQALLALAIDDAELLVRAADLACAMSVEALLGTDRPYDQRVQALRPHPGQLVSAGNLRALLAGSPLLASHRESTHAVQDCYSLRCAPQVHGAVRDVLGHAKGVLQIELGAVVDNPVIVGTGANDDAGPDEAGADVMTTGNFHGQPLAFAADMLAMALSELASISERRTDRLLDPAYSRGLPPFLASNPGINSGYMLAQYTAASLVSENKVLAHPASVDTIPTSGNQEDHVSMGWTSARKLREIVSNVRAVLAVELLCAAQGVDDRVSIARPGPAVAAAHARLREEVAPMDVDRCVADQIAVADRLLPDLVAEAGTVVGGLR